MHYWSGKRWRTGRKSGKVQLALAEIAKGVVDDVNVADVDRGAAIDSVSGIEKSTARKGKVVVD
jgi:hypothetical protein